MPKPGEHKTVQARILEYAEDIGWTIVPREEAEQRRSFDFEAVPRDRAKGASLFFDDLLDAKVRAFNPRYSEAEGACATSGFLFHKRPPQLQCRAAWSGRGALGLCDRP
jgi:hypothetical protein